MNVAICPQHLNILSICTGGGGLDLGVELAVQSARSVCMVEREAFAVAQLVSAMEAGLMAPAPIWSDARTFDGRAWRGAVDGLIGGIPCQPHSLAGRKQGQNDARDLWSTARRIIVQSRAWFVVIENVAGMLSAGDDEIAGAERVCRDLHKLGFAVEGGLFTASEVGASHQRERVFILGVANTESVRGGPRLLPVGSQQKVARLKGCSDRVDHSFSVRRNSGRDHHGAHERNEFSSTGQQSVEDAPGCGRWREADASKPSGLLEAGVSIFPPGPDDLSGWRSALASSPELEPNFRRVADGLATRMDIGRVDRIRMLGNGVVPLQAAYALRTLVTRLAARGSAGAARLVRMMEIAA